MFYEKLALGVNLDSSSCSRQNQTHVMKIAVRCTRIFASNVIHCPPVWVPQHRDVTWRSNNCFMRYSWPVLLRRIY